MLASFFHPSSYLGIFLFIASTGCGMPIPEEAAIVVAGVLSSQGTLHTGIAFAACLAGAIVGDSFMYAIGYRWGHGIFTSPSAVRQAIGRRKRTAIPAGDRSHALKVMLLARFLVGIRAPVYVMTGVVRMPYRRFLIVRHRSAPRWSSALCFGCRTSSATTCTEWVRHAEFTATLVVLW